MFENCIAKRKISKPTIMSIKTFATFALIVGCFAVLYPKFLQPMFSRFMGYNEKKSDEKQAAYPPGYNKLMGAKPDRGQPNVPDDVMQHVRGGPHPGMRAAADMNRHQTQHGSGRGMMGIVLPMYAVGIVLYLIYTLVKVFNKKDPSQEKERGRVGYRPTGLEGLYDNRDGRFTFGDDLSDPDNIHGLLQSQQKQQELEDLLVRADDKNITATEMRELQRRLEETESQMSKILFAMKNVTTKVDSVASDNIPGEKKPDEEKPDRSNDGDKIPEEKKNAEEKPEHKNDKIEEVLVDNSSDQADKGEEKHQDKDYTIKKSSDLSPDMESYEIVKNSAENSPVEENTNKNNISLESNGSEASKTPQTESESDFDVTMSPETIMPGELHKSQMEELKNNENKNTSDEIDTVDNEDVLMEEMNADNEDHTSVRLRNIPSAIQD